MVGAEHFPPFCTKNKHYEIPYLTFYKSITPNRRDVACNVSLLIIIFSIGGFGGFGNVGGWRILGLAILNPHDVEIWSTDFLNIRNNIGDINLLFRLRYSFAFVGVWHR
jgi:hypothetical protein